MLDALTGTLEGGAPLVSATLGAWVPESEVADLLRTCERDHPGCAIGSYPFFREGKVGANFVVRSTSATDARTCADHLAKAIEAAGIATFAQGI